MTSARKLSKYQSMVKSGKIDYRFQHVYSSLIHYHSPGNRNRGFYVHFGPFVADVTILALKSHPYNCFQPMLVNTGDIADFHTVTSSYHFHQYL